MVKALLRDGINFELRVLKQLTSRTNIEAEEGDLLLFLDFGSGQLQQLKQLFEKVPVFILDHHDPLQYNHPNLFHLNPLIYGKEELSSSIVAYWFSRFLNERNVDLVDLALVGAIGDEQDEKWQFRGEIKKLVEEGVLLGKITVINDLRIFGRNLRPLYKALAYTFDPFIPGISGSEAQAVKFLQELGIPLMEGEKWRSLADLTQEEKRKLATAIIYERLSEEQSEDIFGEVYLLLSRPEGLQDARELSMLINACSRMGFPYLALQLALGDYSNLDKIDAIVSEYRKKISDALQSLEEMKKETENAVYILAGSRIPETIIGTITSIYSTYTDKPVFGLSHAEDYIKVSARASKDLNLRDLLVNVVSKIGGEAGGHAEAAGAYIDKDKEQEFIKAVEEELVKCYAKEKD